MGRADKGENFLNIPPGAATGRNLGIWPIRLWSVDVAVLDPFREFRFATRGQLRGLRHPIVTRHPALEPLQILIHPGHFRGTPGGNLVEMIEAEGVKKLFEFRTNTLDFLQIVRSARTRGVEALWLGRGGVGLAGLWFAGLCWCGVWRVNRSTSASSGAPVPAS